MIIALCVQASTELLKIRPIAMLEVARDATQVKDQVSGWIPVSEFMQKNPPYWRLVGKSVKEVLSIPQLIHVYFVLSILYRREFSG